MMQAFEHMLLRKVNEGCYRTLLLLFCDNKNEQSSK